MPISFEQAKAFNVPVLFIQLFKETNAVAI